MKYINPAVLALLVLAAPLSVNPPENVERLPSECCDSSLVDLLLKKNINDARWQYNDPEIDSRILNAELRRPTVQPSIDPLRCAWTQND